MKSPLLALVLVIAGVGAALASPTVSEVPDCKLTYKNKVIKTGPCSVVEFPFYPKLSNEYGTTTFVWEGDNDRNIGELDILRDGRAYYRDSKFDRLDLGVLTEDGGESCYANTIAKLCCYEGR